MNLSDLAAKGAKPVGFLMSRRFAGGLSRRAWLAAFAGGVGEDAERYGCPLLGGDTDRTPGPISVSIAAFGSCAAGENGAALDRQARRLRRRDRHDRRRGARRAAAAGSMVSPSAWRLSEAMSAHLQQRYLLAGAAQRARRRGLAERLRGHGCVGWARRRPRQTVPRFRRRRRDRRRARAAFRCGPRRGRRRSGVAGNGAQRRRRLRDCPDAFAGETRAHFMRRRAPPASRWRRSAA